MQKEKLAVIGLVIIIVAAVSGYLLVDENIRNAIFGNLFGEKVKEEQIIELGDCVDVHYIGRYASNNTVFSSSYEDADTETGGTPLQVFMSEDVYEIPPENYSSYYSSILYPLMMGYENYTLYVSTPLAIKKGILPLIKGMKEGERKTTNHLTPKDAFGIFPQIGDIINLTAIYGFPYEFSLFDIQENASVPPEYQQRYPDDEKMTLYVLRDETHYVGEIISSIDNVAYSSWENPSVVTKINETLMWIYTTPTTDTGENFTWSLTELDPSTLSQSQTIYPENTSTITSLNNSTIVVTHTPLIGDEIVVSYGFFSDTFTVENITSDSINVSYDIDETGENKSYRDLDRQTIIQRNTTQNITSSIPEETLEQVFIFLRGFDENFYLSLNPHAGETVYFELEIIKIYKKSS